MRRTLGSGFDQPIAYLYFSYISSWKTESNKTETTKLVLVVFYQKSAEQICGVISD